MMPPYRKKIPFYFKLLFLVILINALLIYFVKPSSKREKTATVKQTYSVHTSNCRLPHVEIQKMDIRSLRNDVKLYRCSNNTIDSQFFQSNLYSVYIKPGATEILGVDLGNETYCGYQPFWRIPSKNNTVNDKLQFGEKTHFSLKTNVSDEFIKVVCVNNELKDLRSFIDYHSFPPKLNNETVRDEADETLNVIISGISSLSRHQFYQYMPKTAEFLKKLQVIEFMGYNKAEYETPVNLMSLLSGLTQEELMAKIYSEKNFRFDSIKDFFLWNHYSLDGFYTGFAEEHSSTGLFEHFKTGWYNQPTDYYWNTFDKEALRDLGHYYGKKGEYPICMGIRRMYKVLLNSMDKFILSMKEFNMKFFLLYWQNSLVRKKPKTAFLADDDYVEHFQLLNDSGILEKSVLIFLSDHEFLYNNLYKSKNDPTNKLPFLFWKFPNWFEDRYKISFRNFKANAAKLVTTYDIYNTLRMLLSITDLADDEIKSMNKLYSLFNVIPLDRSCENAGIKPQTCACHEWIPIKNFNSTNRIDLLKILDFAVVEINSVLITETKCAIVEVDKIMSANFVASSDKKYYMFTFDVKPSGYIFEAIISCITCNGSDSLLIGPIRRLKRTDKHSSCVKEKDDMIKSYCYCL